MNVLVLRDDRFSRPERTNGKAAKGQLVAVSGSASRVRGRRKKEVRVNRMGRIRAKRSWGASTSAWRKYVIEATQP